MTICSLCLPTLAVPTPLPILEKSRIGLFSSRSPCSTPYYKATRDGDDALPHHSSLDSLSHSAENCPLCRIILQKVEDFIQDFKQIEQNAFYKTLYIDDGGHGLPAEWILRLAQRLDGADGFSVLANSKNERFYYLIGVIGFCVEPEDSRYSISNVSDHGTVHQGPSSPGRVRGARVHPDAGFKRTLDVAAGWIYDCMSNHDGCCPPQSPLPSRLLDLGSFDDPGKIRLWETKGTTRSDSYVTLSHCWGVDASRQMRTTHATLSDHLDSIIVRKLPQTFQDAIKVTRHLGIRFLWIDSLCICQDDPDDWARESAAMRRIYAGAFVTISADSAPGSVHGFLKRPERKYVPITLRLTPDSTLDTATRPKAAHVPAYAFESPPLKAFKSRSLLDLADQPLSSRAWAMQERLLSHRVLHFTSGQIFFECDFHFLSEDGTRILGRWNSLNPGGDKTFEELSPIPSIPTLHQMWDLILQEFTRRQLTVKSDWLPALSGLAVLIKDKLSVNAAPGRAPDSPEEVEYVAGLWSNALVQGLGWHALEPAGKNMVLPIERPLPRERGYIAPTWSPASFEGASTHGMGIDGLVDAAVVTGFSVTPKNMQNPLGEVVDGWISLRAPVVKLELSEEHTFYGPDLSGKRQVLRLRTPHSDRRGAVVNFDGVENHTKETHSWVQKNDLFAVFLSQHQLNRPAPTYHALVVVPVSPERRVRAERNEFHRIGYLIFWSGGIADHTGITLDLPQIKDVVLV